MGAKLVIVHGETIVEPVEPGTNLAALQSNSVDLLAHPGLITPDEAALAKERGIFLEISARRGHSLTNGHVAKTASNHHAMLMLDSDAHGPDDLLNAELCQKIAKGAGLSQEEANTLLNINPKRFLEKLGV
jgi:putative hydrolase